MVHNRQRISELNQFLQNPETSKTFFLPPIPLPADPLLIPLQRSSVLSLTPPSPTLPDTWINMTEFYNALKLAPGWAMISKVTIRDAILHPEMITPPFANMMMSMPSKPGSLAPAHLPMLSDLEDLSPVLFVLMKWNIEKLQKIQSFLTVPWELQSFLDPVPVIPRLREHLNITPNWLVLVAGSATNSLKIATLALPEKQISVNIKWGKRKGSSGRLSAINIRANRSEFFCLKAQEWKGSQKTDQSEPHPELANLKPIKKCMKILAWNARGIARPAFRRNLSQLTKDHDPDLVIISETRIAKENTLKICENLPYNAAEIVEPIGLSGGILILWNSGVISFTTIRKEFRALHGIVEVISSSQKFALTAIYASTVHKNRLELWKVLEDIASIIDIPWLCIGDFNEITSLNEKWGGRIPNHSRMLKFVESMNKCNLIDLGFKGPRFTWFNKRKKNPVFERLDRAWVNNLWITSFPDSAVHHLQRLSSDHNPILLNTKPCLAKKNTFSKSFKFETSWLLEPGFEQFIVQSWADDHSDFQKKLTNISRLLSNWNLTTSEILVSKRKI